MSHSVIPANAGIQWDLKVCVAASLDPPFRGDNEVMASFLMVGIAGQIQFYLLALPVKIHQAIPFLRDCFEGLQTQQL